MRRTVRKTFFCLAVLAVTAAAQAQTLPEECQEAMTVRSPQAQVDLFTRCLDTGRLNGREKADAFKQRAVAYMHLGQHQRAVDDINLALRLRSDDADCYYLRGLAYRGLGQHQRAVDDSTKAISMDSKYAGAYATRAFSLKALGRDSQARSDARRALELDPRVKVPSF